MSEQNNVLKVEHITMQFGGVVAVSDLSLEINRGEIVSLIGPNGAGKTTAFNVITGVYAPTNGRVEFCGDTIVRNHPQGKMKKAYLGEEPLLYTAHYAVEANDPDEKAALEQAARACDPDAFTGHVDAPTPDKITRRGLARTFQNIRLFKSQTVFNNVLIAKHMLRTSNLFTATFGLNAKEEAQQRADVEALLEITGLSEMKNELATNLPYGKQRHLEIARALATKPQLLLLDEPAAGMNPQETQELAQFIVKIKDLYSLTVFVIEHHMDLVMDISDRIYVLDFGRLIAHGTPEVVQNDPKVIEAYLGVSEDA